MPDSKTETLATKVSMDDLRRIDAAIDRLGLGSRRAALNAAIRDWLEKHEAKEGE